MYSKILTKLISETLVPFLGFLSIKIIVTILTAYDLGIKVDLSSVLNLSVSLENYKHINSNILFGFIIFSFMGLSYSLVKSIYFHSSHVSPRISLSVLNFRVGFLVQDSFHLFSQNLIWLIFNFTTLFLTLFLYFLGLTWLYLVIISAFLTLIGTYFFVLDIEYEMSRNLPLDEEEEIFVS
jgi:hypothetical protein